MPPEQKICIVSQSHLCRNPRVLKEALALARLNYVVTILTAIHSNELLLQDLHLLKSTAIKYEFYSDLRKPGFNSFTQRLVKKIATDLQSKLHIENTYSLGYNVWRLLKKCRSIKANLYIMHQELATCIGPSLIKKGHKVAFDFEDWYSEDLLPQAQNKRPIKLLRKAESAALSNGIFSITTSKTLAAKLAHIYNCKQPAVIYNVFPAGSGLLKIDKEFFSPIKLFWFSQTIGTGRGLEEFISILNLVDLPVQLHLLGNISAVYKKSLVQLMPKHQQLFFHPIVTDEELAGKIASFDVGLALELTSPPSRNYTITNKFFQYLQSGLPVITSDTDGQNEAFEQFKPGFKLSQHPLSEEIHALQNWLNDPAELKAARARAIQHAAYYNWENESEKLSSLVKNALRTN